MHAIHTGHLVLVAVVHQPRDLDIARVPGLQRILVGTAPKTLCLDGLAFHRTAAVGEKRRSVRQAAPV